MSVKDVSEETLKDWREAFGMFDKNGDNLISAGELGTVMRNLGQNPTDDDVRKMISDVDIDANGFVDFNEFVSMMIKFQSSSTDPEEEMREAFKVFDKDGNGFISAQELHTVMCNLGENLSEEDIKEMIKEADLDKDGQVNYNEFVKLMVNKM